VRDLTLNKWLLAALLLLMPWAADAAGLGRLTVLSALGQPFSAEIDLVSVGQAEYSSLTAQLGSADAYRAANLQYVSATSGLRLSVERRPDGQAFVRITSTRPINEPFLDLLVELNWASGRLMREYTALLDPPDLRTAAPSPPAPVAAPQLPPAPTARAPVAPPAATVSKPITAAGDYGPIRQGETMGKIAGELKPEGVTLEQMLMALFRSNPDAFIRQNVNLVKAGKILRVPAKEEVVAVPHSEAVKEFRTQVADWNAYRQRVAEAAGTAPEARAAASGKITPRVEDPAGSAPKDVVRLSAGEPPGTAAGKGKPGSPAQQVRTLEEEAIAREKALAEANERIAQLESTIKDMQRLAEIKSPTMAAAQQQAEAKPKPGAKPEAAPAPPAKMDEPVAAPADKPDVAPPDQPAATAAAPKPEPTPKAAQPPPPPPEPELIDTVMENLPLVAGGGVVLLGALYLGLARRRRKQAVAEDEAAIAPTFKTVELVGGDQATDGAPAAKAAGEEVDPLAEAEVYVAYGRDAQAEEILTEAMAKEPSREDIQVKLLEIYSARKDKSAFGSLAQGFNRLTGGRGDNWTKVAAMGFVLDPDNALYEAGRDMAASLPPSGQATNFDFNLDDSALSSLPTDNTIDDSRGVEPEAETVVEPTIGRTWAEERQPDFMLDAAKPATTTTDISFDVPESGAPMATDLSLDAEVPEKRAAESSDIDFNIELPEIDEAQKEAATVNARDAQVGTGSGDFKLELGDIKLDLDHQSGSAPAGSGWEKDTQWYDVQTKFDLAKAYQEMGDKDGAKEILQEVIREGDPEQQAAAEKVLASLG
jgi:pilus assembly protein FimV